jgi:hypothetical protein
LATNNRDKPFPVAKLISRNIKRPFRTANLIASMDDIPFQVAQCHLVGDTAHGRPLKSNRALMLTV